MSPTVRVLLLLLCVLATGPCLCQDAEAELEGLEFRDPFATLSASEIRDKLVVFLITDDDPFDWTKASLEKADRSRLGTSRDVWCGQDFRRSFSKLFALRPDLKDRCIVQRVPAGLPKRLTGGVATTLPRRAVVAICNGNYQLLNLCVGVPDPTELISRIEDAEEVKTQISLHKGDPEKLSQMTMDRTRERVRRMYKETIAKLTEAMAGDESLVAVDEAWIAKYVRFVSELNPIYLFDVKLRFGLDDPSDLIRLLVLEQHCETREDWCESIAPFVVGRPMQDLMNPLVDTTWGTPAVIKTDAAEHEELLRWFSTQRENATLVLSIKPTYLDRDLPWPPPNVNRVTLGTRDWVALEKAMSNHPFRAVSAEELAVVLREGDEMPIHLLAPSRARYIVFQSDKRKPFVIREADIPGKFIKRLEKP